MLFENSASGGLVQWLEHAPYQNKWYTPSKHVF